MAAQDAWGEYWRSGALTTFGDKPVYEGALRQFWTEFLEQLPEGAVVLDLGAGNGALEEIIQRYCRDQQRRITVHAVDAAALAPRITSQPADCGCVIHWHPRTRNEATGLPDNCVDGVIGNFAFEYGDVRETVAEIARVLRPAGRCRFLMHHAESVLIIDTAGEMAVLDAALAKGGLFDAAKAFLREYGNIHKPAQFEKLRKKALEDIYLKALDRARGLAAAHATTPNGKALLATLTQGISSLIWPPGLFQSKDSLLDHLANARRQYAANLARLHDMQRAAVDQTRLEAIRSCFESKGMSVDARPFHAPGFEAPVAWAVDAQRNASK